MKKLDYYQILGVGHKASITQIKEAFKKQSLLFHPDRNPNIKARQQYEKIRKAYEVLSIPELRRKYDNEQSSLKAKTINQNRNQSKKVIDRKLSASQTAYKLNKARSFSEPTPRSLKHGEPESNLNTRFRWTSSICAFLEKRHRIKQSLLLILTFLLIILAHLIIKPLVTQEQVFELKKSPQIKNTQNMSLNELNQIAKHENKKYRNMEAYSLTHDLRLRQRPTTKSGVITTIDQFDEIKIIKIDDDDNWLKVKIDSGLVGYLWESYVGYGDGHRALDFSCNKYPFPRPKHGELLQKRNLGDKQIELSNRKKTDAVFNFYNSKLELEHSIYLYPETDFILTGVQDKSYQVKMLHGEVYNQHCGKFSFPDGTDVIFWLD